MASLPALPGSRVPVARNYDPDQSVQGKLRLSLYAMTILVVVFVVAMILVPIGGAVIGSGQVGVESRVKRVAHPTGGIVSEIFVRDGDRVRKGDILIRFDDTVTGADAEFSDLSVDQLRAQRARLEAERLGAASVDFPGDMARNGNAGARKALADERRLYAIKQNEQAGMRAQLRARLAQYDEEIGGYRAQIAALEQQKALIEPERVGVTELWKKGLVTITRVNQLERTAVDLQGNIAALQARIAQSQARMTEVREQIIQLDQTRRSDAGTQLAATNAALNQQQIHRVSAGDQRDRSVIRAPYSGVIDKLAFTAIGDVVRPAESILEIVPDDERMVVEAMVSPADIDQIRRGQTARIRFTAFNSTATPEIPGKVVVVAPDRTVDSRTQGSFYSVRIEIDQAALAREPGLKLVAGMPAEVFVETGSRSMLSYITKPLRDQMRRAFRDN